MNAVGTIGVLSGLACAGADFEDQTSDGGAPSTAELCRDAKTEPFRDRIFIVGKPGSKGPDNPRHGQTISGIVANTKASDETGDTSLLNAYAYDIDPASQNPDHPAHDVSDGDEVYLTSDKGIVCLAKTELSDDGLTVNYQGFGLLDVDSEEGAE